MPRKYQKVWETLKQKGKVTLEVHPALFERTKKAVIKEKWRDLGFKVINDHDNFFLEFTVDAAKHRMKIVLKQTIGIEDRKPA